MTRRPSSTSQSARDDRRLGAVPVAVKHVSGVAAAGTLSLKSHGRGGRYGGVKLTPTITGDTDTVDAATFLQTLESSRASGTFRLGAHVLRFRRGLVCKASGDVLDTVEAVVTTSGRFEFRAVSGEPTGALAVSVATTLVQVALRACDSTQVSFE